MSKRMMKRKKYMTKICYESQSELFNRLNKKQFGIQNYCFVDVVKNHESYQFEWKYLK